jgi:hypothetical protein
MVSGFASFVTFSSGSVFDIILAQTDRFVVQMLRHHGRANTENIILSYVLLLFVLLELREGKYRSSNKLFHS